MDIDKAKEICREEVTNTYAEGKAKAIATILSELDKKDKIIDEMARLFSKISKGEYVTIEENIEVDKVIEYFTKKVEKDETIN